MSKEESPAPAGGLLSKVVRFVRNPGVHWTELDSSPESQESQYSKQMLKEMIERKRHNDMVRKREFDQLRQIRRREMLQGHRSQDPTGRPSFFQSSMASPDERAVTLKKIDEIEAQMSQQWWKSKQGGVDASSPRAAAAAVPAPAPVSPHAFAPTAPAQVQQEQDDSLPSVVPLFPDNSMEVEGFGTTDANLTGVVPQAAEVPFPELPPLPTLAPEPIAEPEEFVHEPELEEAAIRFANADYAGAEVGLRDVLAQYQQPGAPDTPAALEIWMTLFDFYRATGAQDKFEPLAIEFAARYSRSAPIWFSMPEQLGLVEIPEEDAAIAARKFSWNGPPTLAVSSVAALHALLQRSASPWTLSWARITGIDDAAVPLLADQFTQWADRTGEFAFSGVDKLHALMESKTQAGDRSTGPEWWRLRMAAMRLMGRPDDFEMVALDYCVTYEVSPPSWVPPRCTYTDDSIRTVTPSAPSSRDWMNSDLNGLSVPMALESIPQIKLSGHIDGDATALLEPFEPHLRQGAPTVIACDQLIRMDFAAAGSVLNWAAEQQAKGYVLHFTNLQRLVAVLLNVIGVNEHAFIVPRKN
jgi:anti-anti-sigma regulatory factor